MALILTITFACIFFIFNDVIPIYQEKQWGVLSVYITMMLLVFILNVLIALDFKIPSPADPLKKIVSVIWKL